MISDGQMLPVAHEGVFLAAEHDADVGGVMDGRIEIGVIPDGRRQMHGAGQARDQRLGPHFAVIPQRRRVGRQQVLQRFARLAPRLFAQAHELVKLGGEKDVAMLR